MSSIALLLAEAGTTPDQLRVFGRWKSDGVVKRYIETSDRAKLQNGAKLVQQLNQRTTVTSSSAGRQILANPVASNGISLNGCKMDNVNISIHYHGQIRSTADEEDTSSSEPSKKIKVTISE